MTCQSIACALPNEHDGPCSPYNPDRDRVRVAALTAQMRELGIAKLRLEGTEIILGPAPVAEAAPAPPPTEMDARRAYYRRLIGRDVDPKILEQLP